MATLKAEFTVFPGTPRVSMVRYMYIIYNCMENTGFQFALYGS